MAITLTGVAQTNLDQLLAALGSLATTGDGANYSVSDINFQATLAVDLAGGTIQLNVVETSFMFPAAAVAARFSDAAGLANSDLKRLFPS